MSNVELPDRGLLGRLRWRVRSVSPFWRRWDCLNCLTAIQEPRFDPFNYCGHCGADKVEARGESR